MNNPLYMRAKLRLAVRRAPTGLVGGVSRIMCVFFVSVGPVPVLFTAIQPHHSWWSMCVVPLSVVYV